MKNNKGFIAISLVYSFFLVFLVTLLAIALEYTQNRILLSDVKNEIQTYLNNLAEFNPISIENKEYVVGESISFAGDNWLVMNDEEDKTTVVLKRSLTKEEITTALNNAEIPTTIQEENKTLMCSNLYSYLLCSYESETSFNPYQWQKSIVNKIVEDWFSNHAHLQKAIQKNTIIPMQFEDGRGENTESFIRIPLNIEGETIKNVGIETTDIWFLTAISDFEINNGESNIVSYSEYKEIHPVITINKAI